METLLWGGVGILALACLVRAADAFIGAAEKIGKRLGMPPFAIGISIVAVGTSLPELASGVAAVISGAPELATATAVGSNVTNILLILGLAGIVGGGLRVAYELARVDLPFLFGSALLLALVAFDGEIGRLGGILCLATLCVYLVYTLSTAESPKTMVGAAGSERARGRGGPVTGVTAWTWVVLVVSGAFVHLGAHFTVESVVRLASLTEIGAAVLATSAVALGTSLPELTVTVRSALAGQPEVAVGNVIGSNIFNALGVVGVAALCGPLVVSDRVLYYALPAMLGSTILCFFVLQERELTRWDGWLMLSLYVGFSLELFGWI